MAEEGGVNVEYNANLTSQGPTAQGHQDGCPSGYYLIIGNQRCMKLTRIVKIRVNLSRVILLSVHFRDVN